MVSKATFNYVSAISWQSVLLVKETGVAGEKLSTIPVQSVPITTNVVSSNPVRGEVYSMQLYGIKFVSDMRKVSDFLRLHRFPSPIKLTAMI
jgi:hypothetical protein